MALLCALIPICQPMPDASRLQRSEIRPGVMRRASSRDALISDLCLLSSELLPWPGGHSAGAPPDPIPNSAVKPRRAQGTAVLTVGERVVARPSQQFFPDLRRGRGPCSGLSIGARWPLGWGRGSNPVQTDQPRSSPATRFPDDQFF
jgi:hypothetical protein